MQAATGNFVALMAADLETEPAPSIGWWKRFCEQDATA